MMWNYFLIKEFYNSVKRKKWIIPIVHGSIDFKNFVYAEKKFTLVLIARRSRQYAGVRYLKRGLNMEGRVANWVEVE
jgi:phosphatidylinositol 3,5-bisphosphate 5-phosphatase